MNNYDISSTGFGIEAFVYYDYDYAKSLAEEALYQTTYTLNRQPVFIYHDSYYDVELTVNDLYDEYDKMEDDSIDYDISDVVESCGFVLYKSKGYGDVTYVIIDYDRLKGFKSLDEIKKTIDKLCYEVPISIKVKIDYNRNGVVKHIELYEADLLDDPYNYDKDEVVKKIIDILKKESIDLQLRDIDNLNKVLPENPTQ